MNLPTFAYKHILTARPFSGDIAGQFYDLLRLLQFSGLPPEVNYVFLGNYVGYGKNSIETMCLLLAYKIKYPNNIFLLRGYLCPL